MKESPTSVLARTRGGSCTRLDDAIVTFLCKKGPPKQINRQP